eukprot:TRINITY_DN4804_c1_g3_i4.p1 TRINITY_DN4804_c1_g3~~TRINITY_DN4804_c1_g3_i4.p1  ORF type:complete len:736 (-),score=113.65 TRINITY_DN4804_c1_g3_i4:108-2315(-)
MSFGVCIFVAIFFLLSVCVCVIISLPSAMMMMMMIPKPSSPSSSSRLLLLLVLVFSYVVSCVVCCGFYTSAGGFTYNLTPLKRGLEDYSGLDDSTEYTYWWNFCQDVNPKPGCGSAVGAVFQISMRTGACQNLGVNPPIISDHPLSDFSGVSVTYTNPGSICFNGQPRLTKIVVTCNPTTEYKLISIIEGFAGICTYEIFMESVFACPLNSSLLDCHVSPSGTDALLCGTTGKDDCASIGGCLARLGAVAADKKNDDDNNDDYVDGAGGQDEHVAAMLSSSSSSTGVRGTIYIQPGTYTSTSNCNLRISADLTITSVVPDSVIIDCQGLSRHMTIVAGSVAISDITFLNGTDTDNEGGGCIKISTASVSITGSSFIGCSSTSNGGAIFVNSSNTFSEQRYETSIVSVIFKDNEARSGGGLYALDESLWMLDCSFENNKAQWNGGGIVVSSAIIQNVSFTHNSARGSGGAISGLTPRYSGFEVQDVVISDNSALLQGGGIFLSHDVRTTSFVSIVDTSVTSNEAMLGSGLYLEFGIASSSSSSASSVFLFDFTNTVVSNNKIYQGHRGASAAGVAIVPGAYVQDFSIIGLRASSNGNVDVSCSKYYTQRSYAFCTAQPCAVRDCATCSSACADTFQSDGAARTSSGVGPLCLNGYTHECDHGQCILEPSSSSSASDIQATCECSSNYKGDTCSVYTCGVGDCLFWIPISFAIAIVVIVVAVLLYTKVYKRRNYQQV